MGVWFTAATKCGGRTVVMAMLLAAVLLLLSSCRTVKYVPVESVHTEYRDRDVFLRDSIFLKDSIYIRERGDTVFMERWRTEYRDRVLRDSVYVQLCDTIREPYPVEKELTRWQKVKQDVGGISIGVAIAALILAAILLIRKFKIV